MTKSLDVSVIILTYNTRELTLACLSSLYKARWGTLSKEIIVVDNASSDDTVSVVKEFYPDTVLIQNKKNLGFAAGNNVGIKKARGKYVLLLNSDTEVENDTISVMVSFMETHPEAGAATCKLVLTTGLMDPACHRGFPTPWNAFTYYAKLEQIFPRSKFFGGYHQGYKNLDVPHEVDAISGAFFLVRKEVIDKIGLLDEDFFMYAEDIDWAYRIKEKGWEIWFNPEVSTLHKKKQSGRAHVSKDNRRQTQEYFLTYNKLFYTKHYKKRYSAPVTALVYAFYNVQLWMIKTFGLTV